MLGTASKSSGAAARISAVDQQRVDSRSGRQRRHAGLPAGAQLTGSPGTTPAYGAGNKRDVPVAQP
jgi:hypothetical protein